MRSKQGLQLRKIGKQYMIVEACSDNVNMSNVYSLNKTAAWMWQQLESADLTADELADRLCEVYAVDKTAALRDVEQQLAEWQSYGLIR